MTACDSILLLLENGKVDVKSLLKLRCVASLSHATHLPAGLHVKHNKSDVFNYDIKVAGRTCARLVPSQSGGARTDARTHSQGFLSEHLRIQSSQARPARCVFGSRARRSQPWPILECHNAEP